MELFGLLLFVIGFVLLTTILYIIIRCFISYFVQDTTLTIDDEIINEIITRKEN